MGTIELDSISIEGPEDITGLSKKVLQMGRELGLSSMMSTRLVTHISDRTMRFLKLNALDFVTLHFQPESGFFVVDLHLNEHYKPSPEPSGKSPFEWIDSTEIDHTVTRLKIAVKSDVDGKLIRGLKRIANKRSERELMSELEKKNRDLSNSLNVIQRKNKELENFVYIASHDLQEPLRTVSNFSLILLEDYANNLEDEGVTLIHSMRSATDRMSNLIKSLLEYSRLGTMGKLEKVNLNTTIREVRDDMKLAFEERKVEMKVDKLPVITGYKTEMRLLFQNLISNAIKFSKPGAPPEISIKCTDSVDYWNFEVIDKGIGIEENHQERIFEIFQRLNHKDGSRGTGIGLAHCQKIVNLHEGTIGVKSDPGKGSIFYFSVSKHLKA